MQNDSIFALYSYSNQPGVEIRPYDFGGLGGIYSIDPDLPNWSATYKPIIDKLKENGYKEGEDLFGAPYDFRLAGDGLASVRLCCLLADTVCNSGSLCKQAVHQVMEKQAA